MQTHDVERGKVHTHRSRWWGVQRAAARAEIDARPPARCDRRGRDAGKAFNVARRERRERPKTLVQVAFCNRASMWSDASRLQCGPARAGSDLR